MVLVARLVAERVSTEPRERERGAGEPRGLGEFAESLGVVSLVTSARAAAAVER